MYATVVQHASRTSKGIQWFALTVLALATVRCGGDPFTTDPGESSPDAYAPADAGDAAASTTSDANVPADGSVEDATVEPDAADAGNDDDRVTVGRRDASLQDSGETTDASEDSASNDAGSVGRDADGETDAGVRDAAAVDAGAVDAGPEDAGAKDAADVEDAATCAVPCGTTCCTALEQCCQTTSSASCSLLICPIISNGNN
jgi:hypothetical protein